MNDAPRLVLVHGAGQAARMWRRYEEGFGQRFQLITPDLPGFAGAPGPFRMTTAVECVRDALGDEPAYLAGMSLGATVAAQVAAQHPDLVKRLVLAAPAIAPARTHQDVLERQRRLPGFLVKLTTDATDRASWLSVHDELAATDLTDALPTITAPTLVLCGERDRPSIDDAHRVADAVPDARLVMIPRVGHLVPPAVFTPAVTGFLLG
jgi:3-oxoadipate enol-lactonase